MQGVVRHYDPQTREGVVIRDTDRAEFVLAAYALDGSIFRLLRQGQRVTFALDDDGRASALRLGSEADMGHILPAARCSDGPDPMLAEADRCCPRPFRGCASRPRAYT